MRFDLTDKEWTVIEPHLPSGGRGRKPANSRRKLDAIFFVLRTGIPWRDLPGRYGPYTTAYNCFNRWSARGIWTGIFAALAKHSPDSIQMIDSTIIKAHRAASGAKGGSKIRRSGAHGADARRRSTRGSTATAGRAVF